jgi:alkanesulfonate monooxygenase SsuD/methylene tetrahydromethanopterin reductase-like flavin-dependent oxidoreductase (luciferase family)
VTRTIKVGLVLPMFSGDMAKVLGAARSAESLGYDGVFAFDHFFPPGGDPDRPALEAFTTLAAVAAVTERMTLGTLVTRANLRPPGLVAKMTSAIDMISEGRMVLGIGTGDPIDEPEHHAFGFRTLSVQERRANLAETVTALKALFRGEAYDGGEWVPRLEGPLVPPLTEAAGPPIWIGAQADEVVRMAARMADGWNGWGMHPTRFHHKVDLLRGEAASVGREVEATWAGIVLVGEDETEALRLHEARLQKNMDALAWAGPAERFAEFLRTLADAGATWAILVLAGPGDRRAMLADRVLPDLSG